MPSNETAAPTVQEADQRAERAKASLLSRVELLKHKFTDARHKVDVQAQVTKHPLPAIGIAFALGVIAGLQHTRPTAPGKPEEPAGSSLKHAAIAALAAFGLRLVRNVALDQLGQVAKQWWTAREAKATPAVGDPRVADVEPLLERS
jgi:hypothetical protein